MTTIATDGNSMAGDTLTSGGGERLAYQPKVKRAKDGRVFGCAGGVADVVLFAKWMDDPTIEFKPDDDFEALILDSDGKVFYVGRKLVPYEYMAPMTIGSGAGIALGAMLSGKSPAEAVEVAIIRDIHSGGEVTVLDREAGLPDGWVFEREAA